MMEGYQTRRVGPARPRRAPAHQCCRRSRSWWAGIAGARWSHPTHEVYERPDDGTDRQAEHVCLDQARDVGRVPRRPPRPAGRVGPPDDRAGQVDQQAGDVHVRRLPQQDSDQSRGQTDSQDRPRGPPRPGRIVKGVQRGHGHGDCANRGHPRLDQRLADRPDSSQSLFPPTRPRGPPALPRPRRWSGCDTRSTDRPDADKARPRCRRPKPPPPQQGPPARATGRPAASAADTRRQLRQSTARPIQPCGAARSNIHAGSDSGAWISQATGITASTQLPTTGKRT